MGGVEKNTQEIYKILNVDMQNITFIDKNTVTTLSPNCINGYHYKSFSGLLSIVLTSALCSVSIKDVICEISALRSLKTAVTFLNILRFYLKSRVVVCCYNVQERDQD